MIAALALAELLALYLLFGLRERAPASIDPQLAWLPGQIQLAIKYVFFFGLFFLVALSVVCWSRRFNLGEAWAQASPGQSLLPGFILNLSAFAILAPAAVGLGSLSSSAQIVWFVLWCAGVLAMLGSLVLALRPAGFWIGLIASLKLEILVAFLAAGFVSILAVLSQQSWTLLSDATLDLSYWILSLYETGVQVDASQRLLGADGYLVEIAPACSGYEGIGLVLGFLAFYLAAFRKALRFPNALLLFPVGALVIWLVNSLRIAALVSIGAHVSPEIASHGFHSQAGWIVFLGVAIGLMVLAHSASFLRKPAATAIKREQVGRKPNPAIAYLAPFIALMAGRIIADTFSNGNPWFYGAPVAGALIAILAFRRSYLRLITNVSLVSVLAGLAVGVIWIATAQDHNQRSELEAWLAQQSTTLMFAWLALRTVGSVVLVPVAEEMAFRGYLHRALISRRFETVEPKTFSWLAFLMSTVLFAMMHQRWLAAAFAGAVYALMIYRTNRVADAIAAHMASNAVIAFYAIALQQWSLL